MLLILAPFDIFSKFLNDVNIDFELRWMAQHELQKQKPLLHVFTTHFFTELSKNGASGVARWTKKKGIDIFEKKMIFIPINKDLHWSLCVVVNPGQVLRNHKDEASGDEEHAW